MKLIEPVPQYNDVKHVVYTNLKRGMHEREVEYTAMNNGLCEEMEGRAFAGEDARRMEMGRGQIEENVR